MAIVPALLKCQKSTLNQLLESNLVPVPAQALPKASSDSNIPKQHASADHNVPYHQRAPVEVANRLKEAIIFTVTPSPIISNEKNSMVDKAWKLAFGAPDCSQAVVGTHIGTPSVCQLLGGPSHKIDPQTQDALSVVMLFNALLLVL